MTSVSPPRSWDHSHWGVLLTAPVRYRLVSARCLSGHARKAKAKVPRSPDGSYLAVTSTVRPSWCAATPKGSDFFVLNLQTGGSSASSSARHIAGQFSAERIGHAYGRYVAFARWLPTSTRNSMPSVIFRRNGRA